KDFIRNPSHKPVSNLVLAVSQNSHISSAPDKPGVRHRFGYKSCPKIGALKKGLYYLDVLLPKKSPQFEGSPQSGKIIGTPQGQQIDWAWRRLQARTFRVGRKGQDRCPIAVLG